MSNGEKKAMQTYGKEMVKNKHQHKELDWIGSRQIFLEILQKVKKTLKQVPPYIIKQHKEVIIKASINTNHV
jgi:hypothetical protein